MPNKISKKNALNYLSAERISPDSCLMCEILATNNDNYILYQDKEVFIFLSKYPRFWGHTIVTTKEHVETFTEISENIYKTCFEKARVIALLQEQKLAPSNIFISSIGSSDNRLNTCSHFHIHVLPIYDNDIKPSEVFTWNKGVYQGDEKEWETLKNQLKIKK